MEPQVFVDLLQIYIYIALGFIVGLFFKNNRDLIQKYSSKFLVYVITPMQIFLILTTTNMVVTFDIILRIVILAFGIYLIESLASTWVYRKKNYAPKQLGAAVFLSIFPNSLYYVLPIILIIFTEDLLIIAVIYVSVTVTIKGSILPYQAFKLGSDRQMTKADLVKQMLLFPPFVSILVSVLIRAVKIPIPLDLFLAIKPIFSQITSITGAMLIGFILSKVSFQKIKIFVKPILWVGLWRFLISFLLFLPAILLLTFPTQQTEIRTILLLITCAPPAINNVVFIIFYDFDEELGATGIAALTLVSLLLIPIYLLFGAQLL
jgi:predicted permease